jgi:hypothetical protein
MEIGELAVWEPGKAFCIFFGRTPVSTGNEPHAASPVVPIGRITDDCSVFKKLGMTVSATITHIH